MAHTVLQLLKSYNGNSSLMNEMARTNPDRLRTLVAYLSGRADSCNQMETVADEVVYLELKKKKVNWAKLSSLRAVARLIDEKEVDLLVCQFRRAIAIGVLAALLSKRKPRVIGVLHGIVGGKVGLARKVVNWVLYKRLVKLVSVSENGVGDIIRLNWGLSREKVVAIQNGLDFTAITKAPIRTKAAVLGEHCEDKFIFGAVGRLAAVKNHQRMIQAFQSICDKQKNAVLVIIGSGPLEAQLKKFVSEQALNKRVLFAGYRNDIPEVLKVLDVYVMPSLREGLPLSLLEAMGAGLPVITSNCSGMKEVIGDSYCGELVEPENIGSIAAAMQTLHNASATALKEMGNNARRRALDRFTAERMAADYENLFEVVLA